MVEENRLLDVVSTKRKFKRAVLELSCNKIVGADGTTFNEQVEA